MNCVYCFKKALKEDNHTEARPDLTITNEAEYIYKGNSICAECLKSKKLEE